MIGTHQVLHHMTPWACTCRRCRCPQPGVHILRRSSTSQRSVAISPPRILRRVRSLSLHLTVQDDTACSCQPSSHPAPCRGRRQAGCPRSPLSSAASAACLKGTPLQRKLPLPLPPPPRLLPLLCLSQPVVAGGAVRLGGCRAALLPPAPVAAAGRCRRGVCVHREPRHAALVQQRAHRQPHLLVASGTGDAGWQGAAHGSPPSITATAGRP